jgi:transposase, IS30 family
MSHLTQEQRYTIAVMKQTGHSTTKIAIAIGKDKSVVSRELRRNCDGRSQDYRYELACKKAKARKESKNHYSSLTPEIQTYIKVQLEQKLSPEQIVGLAKKNNIEIVSHETIYKHIWNDKKQNGTLFEHLRTKGKKYKNRSHKIEKRGQIVGRIDIETRPEVVEKRERFGDLEIDTIIGKDHKGAILTINDRATGVLWMSKLKGKDAEELAEKTIEILMPYKENLKTITADNGKEFAMHEKIAQALKIDFYFAQPYCSWQRGSNENLNKLVRQYIPKKTDFENISNEFIQQINTDLNLRPRKRFKFENPLFMLNQKVAFAA